MRSKMIMDAYDSVNPTQQQKDRMLRQILKEGEGNTVSRERRYTAKPKTSTWKRIIPGIAACMALILAAGAFLLRNKQEDPTTAVQKPVVKETEADAAPVHDSYTAVLAKYAAALEEGWTEDQCEIEGISVRLSATEYCRDYLGYQLLDLDGNDREELIISDGNSVIDLYTLLEDGTPVQILSWEEDGTRYLLYENAVIGSEFSGKDIYIMEFYKLVNHQISHSMMELTCEENIWYAAAVGEGRSPISQEEAMAELEAHKQLSLDITRFYGKKASDASGEELELYQLILERYRTALQENWTAETCRQNDISPQILDGKEIRRNLGWCLQDIDGNGSQELVISDGDHLFDLYGIVPTDNGPGHLLCADSNRYQLCESGMIQSWENQSDTTIWRWLELDGIDLTETQVLHYDAGKNQYSCGTSDQNLTPIPKEDAGSVIFAYRNQALSLTPFEKQNADVAGKEALWMETYQQKLDLYRSALRENWDMQQCSDHDISLLISTFTNRPEELCYLLLDMDTDGIQELIITDGTMIYDLYTVADGEIAHLLTGWERNAYRLCEDYTLYNHGSGSAFSFVYNYYRVRNGKLEIVESILFDAQKDPENPWFYSTDGVDYSASLTEKESGAIQESYCVMTVQGFPVLNG